MDSIFFSSSETLTYIMDIINIINMYNGSAPEYLLNQLQDYCPTRALRSGDQNLLSVKKTRIKIGDSSFAVAASILWNALPCQIKKARTIDCFKSMIKTHLFKL